MAPFITLQKVAVSLSFPGVCVRNNKLLSYLPVGFVNVCQIYTVVQLEVRGLNIPVDS